MLRGGSWNNNARNCRSANRNRNTPDNRNNNIGFRLALPLSPVLPKLPELLDGNLASAYSGVQTHTSDLGDKIQTSILMGWLGRWQHRTVIPL
jgi:hypothetical protein